MFHVEQRHPVVRGHELWSKCRRPDPDVVRGKALSQEKIGQVVFGQHAQLQWRGEHELWPGIEALASGQRDLATPEGTFPQMDRVEMREVAGFFVAGEDEAPALPNLAHDSDPGSAGGPAISAEGPGFFLVFGLESDFDTRTSAGFRPQRARTSSAVVACTTRVKSTTPNVIP